MNQISIKRYTRCAMGALLVALAVVCPATAVAQTDAQFTQYYSSPTIYNPAAAGNTDFLRMRAGGRLQWIGIERAPKSFVVAADMPFKFLNKRFGVGLVANTETMGLYKSFDVGAQIGYHFKKWGGQWAVALQVGVYDQSFKGSEVFLPDDDDYHQGTDDAIPTTDVHGTSLDLGAGIFYTHKYFKAGLSCLHINSPKITLNSDSDTGSTGTDASHQYEFTANRTLYFTAEGNIPINNTLFEVIPTLLVRTDMTFTNAELMARARYNKIFSFGVGYRYNDAVLATIAAEIKGFYIGYSFDYSTSAIGRASNGSHEIFAGYSMKLDLSDKNKNRHRSIRVM